MEINEVQKRMEEYIGSEKHKKALLKMEHNDNLRKRNIEKIHQMSVEERCAFIQKVYDKYTSNEYRNKELKLGYYESRCPLYDIIFEYAVQYGKMSLYDINNHFPEEQYEIDGKFIVGEMYGQDSFIYVKPIKNDEVIPHIIKEKEVTIYNSDNKKVITTDNELIFNDICVQIMRKKLSGYYIIFENKKYEIDMNGNVIGYPNTLFNINKNQLSDLVKGRLKNK